MSAFAVAAADAIGGALGGGGPQQSSLVDLGSPSSSGNNTIFINPTGHMVDLLNAANSGPVYNGGSGYWPELSIGKPNYASLKTEKNNDMFGWLILAGIGGLAWWILK